MSLQFDTVALIGKPHHNGANQTLRSLYDFLHQQGVRVLLESRVAEQLGINGSEACELSELGLIADMAIVVGGDGNMLGAARIMARHGVPVLGVNRGNLGFLTDLSPLDFEAPLVAVLDGHYQIEERFLLSVSVYRYGEQHAAGTALNEAVLHPGKIAHMIDFAVHIDDVFMYSQRADGIIVATPTGSTAYALSAGGPILTPQLNAISLVPMFPHTLSCRPIVIDADSEVKLVVSPDNIDDQLQISCDGQLSLSVHPGDEILIRKCQRKLKLIHPLGHSYFNVLRSKLGWGSKLF